MSMGYKLWQLKTSPTIINLVQNERRRVAIELLSNYVKKFSCSFNNNSTMIVFAKRKSLWNKLSGLKNIICIGTDNNVNRIRLSILFTKRADLFISCISQTNVNLRWTMLNLLCWHSWYKSSSNNITLLLFLFKVFFGNFCKF